MGAQKKVQQVEKFATAAEKENEKLRSDNERLSTIIDTGDWNKERAHEMKATQEVLSTERVALTKLIGRLQRQHQSALDQQDQQEQEIKQLKGQLVTEVNIAPISQVMSCNSFLFSKHTRGAAQTVSKGVEILSYLLQICCILVYHCVGHRTIILSATNSW